MLKSTPVRILLAVVAVAAIALAAIIFFDVDLLALIPEPEAARPAPATVAPVEAAAAAGTAAAPVAAAAAPAADTAAGAEAQPVGDGALTFTIDQSASEARFFVNEVLVGIPTEVKGVTSLISGTVTVDPANPAASQAGPISVDASDLKTDRNLRNRAIRRFILETGNYQYITFTPTAISGLPEQAAPGDTFTFQVTGDLQIKDATQPVTFDVDVTADSATQISGLAKATVKRADFNITIPSAPGVADVTDEVRLELAFIANAQ